MVGLSHSLESFEPRTVEWFADWKYDDRWFGSTGLGADSELSGVVAREDWEKVREPALSESEP